MKRLLPAFVLVFLTNTIFSQIVKEGKLFKLEASIINPEESKRYIYTNNYVLSDGNIISYRNKGKEFELRVVDPAVGTINSKHYPVESKRSFSKYYGNISAGVGGDRMLLFDESASGSEVSLFEMSVGANNEPQMKHVELYMNSDRMKEVVEVSNGKRFRKFGIISSDESNYLGLLYLPDVASDNERIWHARMVFFDSDYKQVNLVNFKLMGFIRKIIIKNNKVYFTSEYIEKKPFGPVTKQVFYFNSVDIISGEVITKPIEVFDENERNFNIHLYDESVLMVNGVYGPRSELAKGHYSYAMNTNDFSLKGKSFYPFKAETLLKDATERWLEELENASSKKRESRSFKLRLEDVIKSEKGGFYVHYEGLFITSHKSKDGSTYYNYEMNQTVVSYVNEDGNEEYMIQIPKRFFSPGWYRSWAASRIFEHNGDLYVLHIDNAQNFNIPATDYKLMSGKNSAIFITKVDKQGKTTTELVHNTSDGSVIDLSTLKFVNNKAVGESSQIGNYDFGKFDKCYYKITFK